MAKGTTYGLVGILAVMVVLSDGGKATSRQGALATIADETFGKVVLALVALGLACYAIWRLAEAVFGTSDNDGLEDWGHRLASLARTLIYGALTFTTVKILFGAPAGSENEKTRESTATVLSWPGGRWIAGIAGLVIVGIGLWQAYEGLTKKFEEEWRTGEMSSIARRWACRIGTAGHLARGVVFTLIGIFIVKAALEYDPKDAIGLDGALRKLADAPYGPYLLGIVAAGLICFAVFCFVDARYRHVTTAGNDPLGPRGRKPGLAATA